MTIHIQMLQDIATHARAMADSMQAIVDDCAEQLARRKAAGESEESIMNEPFNKAAQNGFTPYEGPTPFDEKPDFGAAVLFTKDVGKDCGGNGLQRSACNPTPWSWFAAFSNSG